MSRLSRPHHTGSSETDLALTDIEIRYVKITKLSVAQYIQTNTNTTPCPVLANCECISEIIWIL
jgi:hypothetical protein